MATTVKINYRKLATSIASNPQTVKRINTIFNNKFAVAKEELIQAFINHDVTKEIKGGEGQSTNSSGTLGGYGNLFSFLGFENGSDPINPVVDLLRAEFRIYRRYLRGVEIANKAVIQVSYSRKSPRAKLEEVTALPWTNESWLFGIEKGISGFNRYLNRKLGIPKSRSGTGIQVKHDNLRSGEFKPVDYYEALLREFDQKFARS